MFESIPVEVFRRLTAPSGLTPPIKMKFNFFIATYKYLKIVANILYPAIIVPFTVPLIFEKPIRLR